MSILAALEKAKENVAKFKKAKCMLEFLQHRKSNLEELHVNAVRLAKEYAEQAVRTKKLLDDLEKQFEGFHKYVEDNEECINDSKNAEAIAAKIDKLQKQIAELNAKLEAENAKSPTTSTNSTTQASS